MKKRMFYVLLVTLGLIASFGVIMSFKTTMEMQNETGFMQCIPGKTSKILCENLIFYKKFVFAAAPTFALMRIFRRPILKYLNSLE